MFPSRKLECYALSGTLLFAPIPAKAERTNLVRFPLRRNKLKKLVRLQK